MPICQTLNSLLYAFRNIQRTSLNCHVIIFSWQIFSDQEGASCQFVQCDAHVTDCIPNSEWLARLQIKYSVAYEKDDYLTDSISNFAERSIKFHYTLISETMFVTTPKSFTIRFWCKNYKDLTGMPATWLILPPRCMTSELFYGAHSHSIQTMSSKHLQPVCLCVLSLAFYLFYFIFCNRYLHLAIWGRALVVMKISITTCGG